MELIDINNVWQQKLLSYIQDAHPYMFEEDKDNTYLNIKDRALRAEEAFNRFIEDGRPTSECMELAQEYLYEGLFFSPTDFLIEIGIDVAGREMDKTMAVNIYKIPAVKSIFERYRETFGDRIVGEHIEGNIRNELIPFVLKETSWDIIKPWWEDIYIRSDDEDTDFSD